MNHCECNHTADEHDEPGMRCSECDCPLYEPYEER
jgi:hypothetical protein